MTGLTYVKCISLLGNKIDNTLMRVLGSDRELNGSALQFKLLAELVNSLPGISTETIQLINKYYSRDVVTLHLTIDGEGLGLHSSNGAETSERFGQPNPLRIA
jgi:hypothetical protein